MNIELDKSSEYLNSIMRSDKPEDAERAALFLASQSSLAPKVVGSLLQMVIDPDLNTSLELEETRRRGLQTIGTQLFSKIIANLKESVAKSDPQKLLDVAEHLQEIIGTEELGSKLIHLHGDVQFLDLNHEPLPIAAARILLAMRKHSDPRVVTKSDEILEVVGLKDVEFEL